MQKYLKYIIKQFRIWYWYHKFIEIDLYYKFHTTKDLYVCITKHHKIDKYDYGYNNWKYIKLWTFKRKEFE